jgi:hypothetical protein
VIVGEEDAFTAQSSQMRRVFFDGKIRAHSIPDDEHDMLRFVSRFGRATQQGEQKKANAKAKPSCPHGRKLARRQGNFEGAFVTFL